jgi:hypothetical protein
MAGLLLVVATSRIPHGGQGRLSYVTDVLAEVMKLYPAADLRKLQALTIYYMVALQDQFKAQNDVNEALLSGKPTQDLTSIAEIYIKRAQTIGNELGIELQKTRIKLKGVEKKPTDGQPLGSTPVSTPDSSSGKP